MTNQLLIRNSIVISAVVLAASLAFACSDDEPEHAKPESTQGGEGALETAHKNVDEGVHEFQESVKPAAELVDEKTNEAVGEGKKAVKKVTGSDDDED